MKVILSCTDNPVYDFFIPLAIHSWNKLGVDAICFIPGTHSQRMALALDTSIMKVNDRVIFPDINIPQEREVTYFQVARLFAAALDLPENEYLITSDIDMGVFGNVFQPNFDHGFVIYGADLCPPSQYPICYIMAQVNHWRKAFGIMKPPFFVAKKDYMECLDEMLGSIQCDNMRGNYWAKDQEEAFKKITGSGIPTFLFNRSNGRNQFATQRMDRDGWEMNTGIIDAHFPRPGYLPENFAKIKDLFHAMYPEDDLTWMVEYHEKYLKLL